MKVQCIPFMIVFLLRSSQFQECSKNAVRCDGGVNNVSVENAFTRLSILYMYLWM